MDDFVFIVGKGKEAAVKTHENWLESKGTVIYGGEGRIEAQFWDKHLETTLGREVDFPERVVVFGGDGTVNGAVNAIKKLYNWTEGTYEAELFIFPAGTGNDIAGTIGVPTADILKVNDYLTLLEDTDEAFQKKRIDILELGVTHKDETRKEYAVLGIHQNLFAKCNVPDWAKAIGKSVYTIKGALEIARLKKEKMNASFNGEDYGEITMWAGQLFNAPRIAGGDMTNPSSDIFDGEVELIYVAGRGDNPEIENSEVIRTRFGLYPQIPKLHDNNLLTDIKGTVEISGIKYFVFESADDNKPLVYGLDGEAPLKADRIDGKVLHCNEPEAITVQVPKEEYVSILQ
ncbi:MAG: hypothetical protein GOV00_02085 [Candidatus Altiarchaeota archaeon]|nr:hypothetical protein [Candidatus Altiarchaeota archaeon]